MDIILAQAMEQLKLIFILRDDKITAAFESYSYRRNDDEY
jgi:hypothetical protein